MSDFGGVPIGAGAVARISGDGKGLRGPYARWRREAERFAKRNGFFWLPCDLCGEMYGGHEPSGSVPINDQQSRTICPFCTAERQEAAERRLAELGETAWGGGGASSDGRESPVHRIPYSPRSGT